MSNEASPKTFQDLWSRIEESNRQYRAATKPEKRRILAKDALQLLATGVAIANRGSYGSLTTPWEREATKIRYREVMAASRNCEVCALGALMLARVMEKNGNVGRYRVDLHGQIYKRSGLMDAFDRKWTADMEACFEMWEWELSDYENEQEAQQARLRNKAIRAMQAACEGLPCDVDPDEVRLKLILETVVENPDGPSLDVVLLAKKARGLKRRNIVKWLGLENYAPLEP